MFNLFNDENFAADGYIGIVGNVNYGKPTSGAYPGPAVPVRRDLSLLIVRSQG